MPRITNEKNERPTYDEMIDFGVQQVIRAFGKGEDLRGAVALIVNTSAQWGIDNHKERQEKK